MFDFQKAYYILFYSMDHAVKALPKTEENLPSRKLLESALHLVEQEYARIFQYEACKKKQKTKKHLVKRPHNTNYNIP